MHGTGTRYPTRGEYPRLERPRLLEFSWYPDGGQGEKSIVSVELTPLGHDRTELRLRHRQLPASNRCRHTRAAGAAAWTGWSAGSLPNSRNGGPDMLKTYSGSCHCGAIHFQVDIDFDQGTNRCNCSLCGKSRAWFTFVPGVRLRLLDGAEAQAEYRWTPPSKPGPFLRFRFCSTCGVRVYASGDHPSFGGLFYAISVPALDDVDADTLAAAPLRYIDGRHDRFDQAPQDTRLL